MLQKIHRNPHWHGLTDGKMPPFPEKIVIQILKDFDIPSPEKLNPWPYGPFDVLAAFSHKNENYLLKGKHVEQRGERSLFETQFIQKELHRLGFPVARLWKSHRRETLIQGPDWKEEGVLYYEVQQILPGTALILNAETAFEIGTLIARFHNTGKQIDTFLLNKSYWIKDFTARRFKHFTDLQSAIYKNGTFDPEELQMIEDAIERSQFAAWRNNLQWGLTHGDMSGNNLLAADGLFSVVDLDEVGLGEIVGDLVSILLNSPTQEKPVARLLLEGYLQGGGDLNGHDLQAISDALLISTLNRNIAGTPREIKVPDPITFQDLRK